MKEIMAKESSSSNQGVASFEYNPMDAKDAPRQGLLFQMSRPLDDLRDSLLEEFAGRTLFTKDIIEQHSVDTPYISKNYKEILLKMEEEALIKVYSEKKRRKNTFADHFQVTFPQKAT